jgi:betaine lipid synthase
VPQIWEGLWLVRLLRTAPSWVLAIVSDAAALLLFNRVTLWFGGGIPWKQYDLIVKDGIHLSSYAARTFDGVARHSHLAKSNYFYYNCLTGRFAR